MYKKPVKKAEQYAVRSNTYGDWWDEIFKSVEAAQVAVDKDGDNTASFSIYKVELVATGTASNKFTWITE